MIGIWRDTHYCPNCGSGNGTINFDLKNNGFSDSCKCDDCGFSCNFTDLLNKNESINLVRYKKLEQILL